MTLEIFIFYLLDEKAEYVENVLVMMGTTGVERERTCLLRPAAFGDIHEGAFCVEPVQEGSDVGSVRGDVVFCASMKILGNVGAA